MVRAERDAQRLALENAVDAAVADFFEAAAGTAEILEEAKRRAAALIASAQAAAAGSRQTARDAIRQLRDLGETQADIAALTGLPAREIREVLTAAPTPPATCPPTNEPNEPNDEVPGTDTTVLEPATTSGDESADSSVADGRRADTWSAATGTTDAALPGTREHEQAATDNAGPETTPVGAGEGASGLRRQPA